jgi:hypothetical protein
VRPKLRRKPCGGMMYSPEPMEDREQTPDIEGLEMKVGELERLADSLHGVPDEELVGVLDRTVELLREINTGIETELDAADRESREIGEIVEGLDLGPFDEALEEIERQERNAGETGAP